MRRLIYDCEIIRCIPPKGIRILTMESGEAHFKRFGDGFEYCDGWDDFENMGISVIGVSDLESGELFYFSDHSTSFKYDSGSLGQFEIFAAGAEIWGFNSINFDDNLCAANNILVNTDRDLLQLLRLAAYGLTNWQDQPRGHSYSLDAIARANGYAKSGSGELAPKLWQQGKYQEVIDYCLNDCQITRELILLYEQQKLVDPNTGKVFKP